MTTQRILRTIAISCLLALPLAPLSAAVPDAGMFAAMGRVEEDNPDAFGALPCRQQGVVWTGLENPLVGEALRRVGDQVCDQIMLDSVVTMVRSEDPVTAEVHEDGEVQVRITFPLVRTPIMMPFHDQETDSETFVEDAVNDVQNDPTRWVPYMLDLNQGVPCFEGSLGVPSEAIVDVGFPWSIEGELCDEASVASPLVYGDSNVHVSEATIRPPSSIASVQRIFLLRVEGYAPDATDNVRKVYEQSFANVAVVNNLATEALGDVREQVEAQGATLESTVFEVTVILTEAQLAAGDQTVTPARLIMPLANDVEGILLHLPNSPGGGGPLGMTQASGAQSGECSPTPVNGSLLLSFENGCVGTYAWIFDKHAPDKPWTYTVSEGYYERQVGEHQWIVVTNTGSTYGLSLPFFAGRGDKVTMADAVAKSVTFRLADAAVDKIRIQTLWILDGDVERRCDATDGPCVAGGATLDARSYVDHYAPGSQTAVVAYDERRQLYAAPMIYCAPDIPFMPPVYTMIEPFFACFAPFFNGGFDHQTQAFNRFMTGTSVVVDLDQYPGWLTPRGEVHSQICCMNIGNLPSLHVGVTFAGFLISGA